MRITEHFTYEEFVRTARHPELQEENRASGAAYAHNMLALGVELEKIREHFARPIFITSGYRCPALNAAVGGVSSSEHLDASAVDFVVKDFQDFHGCKLVFKWARRNCSFGQIILEAPAGRKPWIHMGLPRLGKAPEAFFWNGEKYERVG